MPPSLRIPLLALLLVVPAPSSPAQDWGGLFGMPGGTPEAGPPEQDRTTGPSTPTWVPEATESPEQLRQRLGAAPDRDLAFTPSGDPALPGSGSLGPADLPGLGNPGSPAFPGGFCHGNCRATEQVLAEAARLRAAGGVEGRPSLDHLGDRADRRTLEDLFARFPGAGGPPPLSEMLQDPAARQDYMRLTGQWQASRWWLDPEDVDARIPSRYGDEDGIYGHLTENLATNGAAMFGVEWGPGAPGARSGHALLIHEAAPGAVLAAGGGEPIPAVRMGYYDLNDSSTGDLIYLPALNRFHLNGRLRQQANRGEGGLIEPSALSWMVPYSARDPRLNPGPYGGRSGDGRDYLWTPPTSPRP